LAGHCVVDVHWDRHAPFTQSLPLGHCVLLVHWFTGAGRHSPDWHVSLAEHCVFAVQPR
jgi:hypothetical protein